MTGERWQEIRTVLEAALQMDSEKRLAYLDQACSSDQSLRREVESLLAADKQAQTGFLKSPPLAMRLEKGTRLGEYEIQSLLGSGGMGEVYRARDLRLRRDVAVKVLPAVVSSDPERMRRFEQEATAAAALNHPNILAVHQLGTYAGAPYLVSELLEGETLREQMRHGRIVPRRVIDYGVQIAHGLAAAHEKGVVHRDLKPENLFVTVKVRGSTGRFATLSRSSRNGSLFTSKVSGVSSFTVSPIETSRSARKSPRPLRSRRDITTSIFVLN